MAATGKLAGLPAVHSAHLSVFPGRSGSAKSAGRSRLNTGSSSSADVIAGFPVPHPTRHVPAAVDRLRDRDGCQVTNLGGSRTTAGSLPGLIACYPGQQTRGAALRNV